MVRNRNTQVVEDFEQQVKDAVNEEHEGKRTLPAP